MLTLAHITNQKINTVKIVKKYKQSAIPHRLGMSSCSSPPRFQWIPESNERKHGFLLISINVMQLASIII